MAGRVLIVGLGDLGRRYADALAASGTPDALILAGGGRGRGPAIAGMIESCHGVRTSYRALDATSLEDTVALFRAERPDIVLQCGSLFSPWEILAGDDPFVVRLRSAGVGIQLPAQIPILLTVMRAVREAGLDCPVVNLSWPDGTNPIMAKLGLAPTLGLGNATMIWARVRAALGREGGGPIPPVRILGDASTLWACLTAERPEDPERGCRVYLGEDGRRDDSWAYRGHPLDSGAHLNALTCWSSLAVLLALLPGGAETCCSCPGVDGLYGGYPVRVAEGKVGFDLPPGVSLEEAVAFNHSLARDDGIAEVREDGTVIYTEAAQQVMADIDPVLAQPLAPDAALGRFGHLVAALKAGGSH